MRLQRLTIDIEEGWFADATGCNVFGDAAVVGHVCEAGHVDDETTIVRFDVVNITSGIQQFTVLLPRDLHTYMYTTPTNEFMGK